MRIYNEYLVVKLRCRTGKVVSTFDIIDGVEVTKEDHTTQIVKIPLKKEDCVFTYLKILKEDRPDCEIIGFSIEKNDNGVNLEGKG